MRMGMSFGLAGLGSSLVWVGTAGATPNSLAGASAIVAKAESGQGALQSVALGPVKPPKHLSVEFIAATPSAPGVQVDINALKQAAALVNYSVNVCDGGGTAQGMQTCINTGIAQHPTAMINQGSSPSLAPQQYEAAKQAGIIMLGQFDGPEAPTAAGDTGLIGGSACRQQGEILGAAIAAKSHGKANVGLLWDPTPGCITFRKLGIESSFNKYCPKTCTVKTIPISFANAASIPAAIHGGIEGNPNLTWVVGPTDFVALEADTEIQQEGKEDSISSASFDGDLPNLKAMQGGGSIEKFDIVAGDTLLGYLDVDLLMRLKDHLHVPNDTLVPTEKLFTPANVPQTAAPGYHGPNGYQEAFKKLWGV